MRIYNFDEVIGNVATITVMRQSLSTGIFPAISVFSGAYGTGKSTCAEIVSLCLTCDHENCNNPCGTCTNCRTNIKALQTTGKSANIEKINVGQKNTKNDVDEIIHNIFSLDAGAKNKVFIIEEAHSLNEAQQTALLEELDKIPLGVHVIFCTTKPTKLLPELRSRAITFTFNRLNNSESAALLEKLCVQNRIALADDIKNVVLDYAKGVPRQIVNLVEFIAKGDFESQTITEFLGVIDDETFIDLFESMQSNNFLIMINCLDNILKHYTLDLIIEQLKNFTLKVLFLREGGITDNFTSQEVKRVNQIFKNVDILGLNQIVYSIAYNATEADFKYKIIKIRQLILNKKMSDIIQDNLINASAQQRRAKVIQQDTSNSIHQRTNETPLTKLDFSALASMEIKNESKS